MELQSLASDKLELILGMVESLPAEDRFERLLAQVRETIPCDAAALLRYQDGIFYPLAIAGLVPQTLEKCFAVTEHPRLAIIAENESPTRFDASSSLPDPYDKLVAGFDNLPNIHDCMGIPLRKEGKLLGALTMDSITAGCFDSVADTQLESVSEVGAAALHLALHMSELEQKASECADDLWKQFNKLSLRDATDAFQRRLLTLALEDAGGPGLLPLVA
ncbi:GAF domain-containing protein [Dongshaea marina]|uniref:GAF domain-containing protein n=1 Tax=Dongshaea marina TaxID=2047966 RepID=UPI000D3E28F3|nr:GAF domain-containing protein [Dongshaea marina]